MMALGRIFEHGIGTKIDVVKAFFYYDQAAAKDEPYSLYWLGKACEVSFHNMSSSIGKIVWTAS